MSDRAADTSRFYDLLGRLATRTGGPRVLRDCSGRMDWPRRGVYFFFEPGETRSGFDSDSDTGTCPGSDGRGRVVRVGTHGLTAGSKSVLWGRLSQHRGDAGSGRGNHRGSIFRLLVGIALAQRNGLPLPPSWGVGNSRGAAARRLGLSPAVIKDTEENLERLVSRYIGQMPFLWLDIPDEPGPNSRRGFIERNAIALLSSFKTPAVDRPSHNWLGLNSDRERVRQSGLWNNAHVEQAWHPDFLAEMELRIEAMSRPRG